MIIVMKSNASEGQVGKVREWIESIGYKAHLSQGWKEPSSGPSGTGEERSS